MFSGMAEETWPLSFRHDCLAELHPAEVRLVEVGLYVKIFLSPSIPTLHPLPEKIEMLLVRHRYESPPSG